MSEKGSHKSERTPMGNKHKEKGEESVSSSSKSYTSYKREDGNKKMKKVIYDESIVRKMDPGLFDSIGFGV
jgi:hypothetical protein